MSPTEADYDEAQILATLETLEPLQRTAFSSAIAERLFPTYEWFASRTGQGNTTALRSALDVAWALADSVDRPRTEVEEQRDVAELLVPDDEDEDWSLLSPLAQNASASVAYALRGWLCDDPQEGVWAARQLHEAADYLVQLRGPTQSYTPTDTGDEVMVLANAGIRSALNGARSGSLDELRATARVDGAQLRHLLDQHA